MYLCILDMKQPSGFAQVFCIFKNYHMLTEIYWEAVIKMQWSMAK